MITEMQLLLVASVLKRGRSLDRFSTVISLLALAYGLAPLLGVPTRPGASLLCGLLVVIGMLQKFWALRVALDAELFIQLTARHASLQEHTQDLDQALLTLGLQAPTHTYRDWHQRCQGALRLLRWQALCLLAQLLLALGSILVLPWFSLAG